ncbi:pyruvate kinase [bacterium]|nr:pyruvate kinase [bacterium]
MKRKAKIIATIGPASSSYDVAKGLILAGVNVFRVNMSHGSHSDHNGSISNIRKASTDLNIETAILADLQGPKIRVDKIANHLDLARGENWAIGLSSDEAEYKEFKNKYIPTTYGNIVKDCKRGDQVLFDDGLIRAVVTEKKEKCIVINIEVGGTLKSNKGINLPDTKVSISSFTSKDQKDLDFALDSDVDYVALSFVRTRKDVSTVQKVIDAHKNTAWIISKIENPEGIENLDEIMEVSSAIMVARGDMGVEIGNHKVPSIQKEIIRKCNNVGIPVITATQMLESMILNSTPTRAEANDVANAVWDGTGVLMLSGETAVGKYPIETIKMMDKIIREAEKTPSERPLLRNVNLSNMMAPLMVSASLIAEKLNARAIISITEKGGSCLEMTRFRPINYVLGVTHSLKTVRRMCLFWGISPYLLKNFDEEKNIEPDIISEVKDELHLVDGDKIVITRGDGKILTQGRKFSVRIETIGLEE